MTSPELENLARAGLLRRESYSASEFEGLRHAGKERLRDARNASLTLTSRFDLAYNAAHALALAALRRLGYRSDNRYLVFQALPHTLGLATEQWRVLAKCHTMRNQAEYEGYSELTEGIVDDLIAAADAVRDALAAKG